MLHTIMETLAIETKQNHLGNAPIALLLVCTYDDDDTTWAAIHKSLGLCNFTIKSGKRRSCPFDSF